MMTAAQSELAVCFARVLLQARNGLADESLIEMIDYYRKLINAAIVPPVECWAADKLRDTPEAHDA